MKSLSKLTNKKIIFKCEQYKAKSVLIKLIIGTIILVTESVSAANLNGTIKATNITWSFTDDKERSVFILKGTVIPYSQTIGIGDFLDNGGNPITQIKGDFWEVDTKNLSFKLDYQAGISPVYFDEISAVKYSVNHFKPAHPELGEGSGPPLTSNNKVSISSVNAGIGELITSSDRTAEPHPPHNDILTVVLSGTMELGLAPAPATAIYKKLVDWEFNATSVHRVPEPNLTLSLLVFGVLGAASTLKRKLKSSKNHQ